MTKTKSCAHGLTLCPCSLVLLTPFHWYPLSPCLALLILSCYLVSTLSSLSPLSRFATSDISMTSDDTSTIFQWLIVKRWIRKLMNCFVILVHDDCKTGELNFHKLSPTISPFIWFDCIYCYGFSFISYKGAFVKDAWSWFLLFCSTFVGVAHFPNFYPQLLWHLSLLP